jgi:hypothetical protein
MVIGGSKKIKVSKLIELLNSYDLNSEVIIARKEFYSITTYSYADMYVDAVNV